YDASHARNTHEFQDVVSRSFLAPAQNMLVADRNGSIAIRSTGHFPIRAGDGDGETIRDGSTSASDWRGFWPIDRYPQSFDPKQGFLASANQEPEAPEASFGYLGTDHGYEVWRALRINQLLRADSQVTPDDMIRWQTDPGSTRADGATQRSILQRRCWRNGIVPTHWTINARSCSRQRCASCPTAPGMS